MNVVLLSQVSRCYKQVKIVDDMNDSGSHEIKPLNAMNRSRLWKHERLQVVSSMNSLRLWMTWTPQDLELWDLDVKNNSRV